MDWKTKRLSYFGIPFLTTKESLKKGSYKNVFYTGGPLELFWLEKLLCSLHLRYCVWEICFMLCSSQQTDLPSSNVHSYIKDNLGALKTRNSNLVIIIRRSPRNSGAVCLSWFQPARSKKIHLIQSRWLSIKYNLVLIGATLTSTCEVCFVVYKSSFKCSNTFFHLIPHDFIMTTTHFIAGTMHSIHTMCAWNAQKI